MNTNDMRDNIMGRIAIAVFGEHNNRTDEECVVEIVRLRAERDEARADALALAAERNNWQSMYQDAMAERDEAREQRVILVARIGRLCEIGLRIECERDEARALLKGDAK